jgi:hypothetical protein
LDCSGLNSARRLSWYWASLVVTSFSSP